MCQVVNSRRVRDGQLLWVRDFHEFIDDSGQHSGIVWMEQFLELDTGELVAQV